MPKRPECNRGVADGRRVRQVDLEDGDVLDDGGGDGGDEEEDGGCEEEEGADVVDGGGGVAGHVEVVSLWCLRLLWFWGVRCGV
jgi:hypothetical protein